MNAPQGSWKTTLAGVAAIITALGTAHTQYNNGGNVDFATLIPALLAGLGLVFARDNNKSSVDVGIQREVPKHEATKVVQDIPPIKPL